MKRKSLLRNAVLPLVLLCPLLGSAAQHGEANPNAAALDSEHQVNMANIVNRNQDNVNADPTVTLPDWFKKITISGVVDPGLAVGFGNRPFPVPYNGSANPLSESSGGPSQSLGLLAAELYVDAQVADWVLVHTTLAYDMNFNDAGNYATGYNTNGGPGTQSQTLFVEEAAVTLANFEKSPLFVTVGRQYLPFGSYKHHSIFRPLTQYLSEGNNVGVNLGAVQPMNDLNFYANAYGFQGMLPVSTVATQSIPGFGANVGVNKNAEDLSYNFNVGMINNMMNAYLVGNACNPLRSPLAAVPTTPASSYCTQGAYNAQVPGLSLHFDAGSGPFDFYADYVTALTQFSGADLPSGNNPINASSPGAKPWAYSLEASFGFPTFIRNKTYDSHGYLTFQQSGDAVNVSSATVLWGYWMPEYRYAVGYAITPITNVSVRLQYQYDVDYSVANGGTGLNNNSILADLKVLF